MEKRFNDDEMKYMTEEVNLFRDKLTDPIYKDTVSLAERLFHEINNSNQSIPDFGVSALLDLLDRMLQQKPLSELEDLEEEWEKGVGDYWFHKRYFYFIKKKENDESIKYYDNNRIKIVNISSRKSEISLGPIRNVVNELFPIHPPYYPPTNPYKVFISQIGTDYEAIHKIITPSSVSFYVNKAYKRGEDGFDEMVFNDYVKLYWGKSDGKK